MHSQDIRLQELRKTLDEQRAVVTQINEEMQALGMQTVDASIDLDALSQADRELYLSFERELHEVTGMIKPQDAVKPPTSARPRKRQML